MRSPAALALLAIGLGAFAQLALFGQAPGLGLPLVVAALLGAAWLVRPPKRPMDRADAWLAPAALVFASLAALRTDAALLAFDLPAAAALALAAVAAIGGARVTRSAMLEISLHGARAVAAVGSRAGQLLEEARPRLGRAAGAVTFARGLLLAAPFVLVFATIFSAADAVFSRTVADLFDVDVWRERLGDLPGRAAFALGAAWVAGGVVEVAWRGLGPDRLEPLRRAVETLPRPRAGADLVVGLLALDALFAFFAGLQIAYLFGGRDTLDATGLTYSEYARRGFSELIAATALVGAIVVAIEWLPRPRGRALVVSEIALLALTFLVLVSALYRLQLYQAAYGWSELRFYALAAIAWLAASGVAAVGLVATGFGRWLPHVAIAAALVVALSVNLVGPQGFVAEQNLRRFVEPAGVPADGFRGLDTAYLATLGDDAVPVILSWRDLVPAWERPLLLCPLRSKLGAFDDGVWPATWQSWNFARERARAALVAARGEIEGCSLFASTLSVGLLEPDPHRRR